MSASHRRFQTLLVANRGEIALRVIRACREFNIKTIAIYSDADREALHVRAADEAVHIGPTPPAQSYLNIERIVAAATRTGAQAVHPGYGFLAESAAFAQACAAAKLVFIGPSARAIALMGDKLAARANAERAGVPIVPGTSKPVTTAAQVREVAAKFGYPLAIKASAGGGGRGLKVAWSEAEVEQAVSLAGKEAGAYFGDPTVYVERYLPNPKHVEVQVLGDQHGNAVNLGERDCSLQRRHQKLVEETPACIEPALRTRMHEAAVRLATAIGYDNAGTIECLVQDNDFYFLEMNTRIQVEHPISEMVFGVDLVKAQIRVAAGERLWFSQNDLVSRGHAIECRVNAESPQLGFAPAPGCIVRYREPGGPGIRIDSAATTGSQIPPDYDSLIAKLVAWGADRTEAHRRMRRALSEYDIGGVQTTIPFYQLLLDQPAFMQGDYSTTTVEQFVRDHQGEVRARCEGAERESSLTMAQLQDASDQQSSTVTVEVDDKRFRVRVFGLARAAAVAPRTARHRASKRVTHAGQSINAPMHGIVAEVRVGLGDAIADGQVVAVIEAMKMMNEIIAHASGVVAAVNAAVGDTVEAGSALIVLDEAAR